MDEREEEYTVREPIEPAEIGHLIRLIIRGGFPNIVSEQDRYIVAIDSQERIVGGVFYKLREETVAHLDGIVVAGPLKGRGLSGVLLEDFCSRMESQGVEVVTTHFFARHFYQAHGFRLDKAWGGLVRFLGG
jgi:N-acetylglutamate synthase-like GNAT family acetyltransferase